MSASYRCLSIKFFVGRDSSNLLKLVHGVCVVRICLGVHGEIKICIQGECLIKAFVSHAQVGLARMHQNEIHEIMCLFPRI